MSNLDTISTQDLSNVIGGAGIAQKVGGALQGAYKWWTGSKTAGSPQQIYQAGREVAKDVGTAAGAGAAAYGGKQILDAVKAPSATPSVPTGP